MENTPARRSNAFLFYILIATSGFYAAFNTPVFQPFSEKNLLRNYAHAALNSNKGVYVPAGQQYKHGAWGNFWLGKHNRELWVTFVNAPVFIGNEFGGLKVSRKGGGMQTTSFTLSDSAGEEYALRSIDKDPVAVLPAFLWPTILASFVRDQVSATNPYAPLVIAELSSKTGVFHPEPHLKFVSLARRPLSKYGNNLAGLYILSRKVVHSELLKKPGEKFINVYSTEEMLQVINKRKQLSVIDTGLYLKCRLFDLYISDWDRHQGQWDWGAYANSSALVFRPLPKDRDQAFCYYQDGVIPFMLTRDFAIRKFTSFTLNYEDVEGFSKNGSQLDDRILKNITKEEFSKTAVQIKESFTDEIIRNALKKYPDEIYPVTAEKDFIILKSRRDKLPDGAAMFYEAIQKRNKR